jgi:hypothetical protein
MVTGAADAAGSAGGLQGVEQQNQLVTLERSDPL